MVARLAKMGMANKIDAIICSGEEVPMLQKALGPKAAFVTPGIRPAGGEVHDQKRFVTPAEAARMKLRYAVIGRPIIKADKPLAAAQDILTEMRNA
jgi:orotidine-5'-phosphate decarboxylase